MEKIIVYEKTSCSKSKETIRLLTEAGVPFEIFEYYDTPLDPEKLLDLARKLGMSLWDLLRTNEPVYAELDLEHQKISERELAEIMVAHPDLIQRPIVEMGDFAVLGRPPEKIQAILDRYTSLKVKK
ncbi:MAG TPA: arsenate reductase family protein [Candidatus Paceibacterota bacterium]|nr:arsenate reductase family protein [Candidatus Paceibacterota bacterium]